MPHLSEILKAELATLRERLADPAAALDILETGTIRDPGKNYQANDGWSTLTFAEDVAEHGGTLTAIDLDTTAATIVLTAYGLGERDNITLLQGHSIETLAGVLANAYARTEKTNTGELLLGGDGFLDVAFLDSDNHGALILHEYLVVRHLMRAPGLIMVDDVDMESADVTKGHQIVPWLDAHGIPYRLEKRHGDGYETGVLVISV